MYIKITNIYTDKVEEFSGEPPAVAHDIAVALPWLQEYGVRLTDLNDVLQECEMNQALVVEVDPSEPVVKFEDDLGGSTAKDMLGHDLFRERLFDAAKWLSGFKEPKSDVEIRGLMLEHDGDMEAVALLAYGLEDDDKNKKALKAVLEMEQLGKAEAESPVPPHSITPGTDTAYDVCQSIKRAYRDHHVQFINLDGKHSKGSMLAKDGGRSYILKSGSGGQSPAAGAKDEIASQGRREAAFYAVAKAWGLESFLPAAEFVVMDGHDWAVLGLLDHTYKNLEKIREDEPRPVHDAHEAYRLRGILHRWAVIDGVLGNGDRHAANEMINPEGKIRLIDHGSAFAGAGFDPGNDKDSFVPFYLRYLAGDNFYEMTPEEQLEAMPHLPESHDEVLVRWVHQLDRGALTSLLRRFGIDPGPSSDRLQRLLSLGTDKPLHVQLHRLWLGLDSWVKPKEHE